jgi:hypothetical protein
MRGLATAIFVGFISVILFVLVAPAILEPMVEVFINDPAVQSSQIDETQFANGLLRSVLVWAPLFVMGAGVVSAVIWYFRRERRTARRVR